MSKSEPHPTNLLQAIERFSDLDVATDFVAKLRWPDGPVCPRCGSTEHGYIKTRRLWKCRACKRQYSVKVGTIFEDSPLGLNKWLPAIWLAANSKNGISSHELARALGITQKSAWFMLHRIRLAMQAKSFARFSGEVEADETWIGGKARNMHKAERERKRNQSTVEGKTPVFGMLERGGRVHAEVVPDIRRKTLRPRVIDRLEIGAALYTDELGSYGGLDIAFEHQTIDHSVAYVDGRVHTNSIESFWALLKRGLKGTYVSVDPSHLFRYVDERVFTFNERTRTDFGRFSAVVSTVAGRRLTCAEVTGQR